MMEEIMKQIMLYHRIGIGCLVGMLIAMILTIYNYKKLNMKEVLDYFKRKNGRKIKKGIFLFGILMSFWMSMPTAAAQMEGASEDETEQSVEENDKTAPELEVIYKDEDGKLLNFNEEGSELLPYYNPAKEIFVEFKVTEDFPDEINSIIKVTSKDGRENLIKEETVKMEEGCGQIVIKEDGHYLIEAYLVDRTGNETTYEKRFALDHTPPQKPLIKYKTENQGFLARMINQLTFGYFAKEKITASIQVEDKVSGVKQVTYTYQNVDSEKVVTETVTKPEEEILFELPISFRGTVSVSSEDFLGNMAETYTDIGVIAESEETHEESAMAEVQVLTSYSKTSAYYAGDVEVKFIARDSYSGIQKITYLAGTAVEENVSFENVSEIVTEEIAKEYQILAADNQNNEISLGLTFEDNAGHQTALREEELPKIHIDTVAPKIQVTYDNYNAENEKYYDENRIATIFVEERNFDPKDVHFNITGPEIEIPDWNHQPGTGCEGSSDPYDTGHSDFCVWKTQLEFKVDGEYRFGFACTDLAGNEGHYDKIDEFVIDKTNPVIHVDYDNQDVRNEIYYRAPRTARITVTEKNFDPEDVEIYLNAENEELSIALPKVSAWTSSGERHQAVIKYDYDGNFSFDIFYKDLAGNEAADYLEDYFVIDLTKPQILIGKIEDQSANNGEVSPVIMVTDKNYMGNSIWTELIGWQNGLVDVEKVTEDLQNGLMIKINDFEYRKESDDLYRLTVGAEDLAGNAENVQIRFSVNRFGSVYTLDDVTEKLAGEQGSYYTDKEKRIVITETNVDTLVFQEIVCSLNGKMKTLREGADYKVEESGDDTSWKQYRYTLYPENFKEEGHYTVTVYSEDRAQNISDNQSKGESISFAVDKSAPSIVISGIEQEGRYKENSRRIIVDVQDNLDTEKLIVFLNNEAAVYEGDALYQADGKIEIEIKGSNQWQTLKAVAKDRTGNEVSTPEITFLVTPNLLVQFYHQKQLFYGTIAVAGIGLFLVLHKILRFSLFNSSNS